MALVHMILQGKGGVGKTVIATLLTEHYKAHDVETVCVDTDPNNATFTSYEAYYVHYLELVDSGNDGDDVDPEKFDELVEIVMGAPEGSAVIVDNGVGSFIPLCSSLKRDGIVTMLKERGDKVMFHTVVAGGEMMTDTLRGYNDLCENFPDVDVVVWRNEYFGPIKAPDGTGFDDFKICRDNAGQTAASIVLPFKKPETYGRNLRAMRSRRLSFEEVKKAPGFSHLARHRLARYLREMEEKMQKAIPVKKDRPRKAGNAAPLNREAEAAPEKLPAKGNGTQAPGQDKAPEDKDRAAQTSAATNAAPPEAGS